ncbi:MAG: hypothetical protein NTW79_00965 [Candidatus Berkelbacteria bacterium]|nr:hypothetical protein [Candidatus Berkelbacteria bacterium]
MRNLGWWILSILCAIGAGLLFALMFNLFGNFWVAKKPYNAIKFVLVPVVAILCILCAIECGSEAIHRI